MKKSLLILPVAILLASSPVLAGADHEHNEAETAAPTHGHGSPQDDHSKIEALDITPEEAVVKLEDGLNDLSAKIESGAGEEVINDALSLMAVVKTLQSAEPSDRQLAALRQLDQQLDAAKHAAEDKDFEKAKSSLAKAQSALKLYKAVQ